MRATKTTCFLILFAMSTAQAFQSKLMYEKLNGYNLDIYLPEGYNSNQHYNTIYFNDGQMVFGATGLNLKASLDSLIQQKVIAPVIVVGVHADQQRTEKYVPYDDPYIFRNGWPSENESSQYASFLIDQLIPFVESKFSTSKQKEDRAIFGLSFGGLQATWMALNHPELFGFCGGLSPSYWVADSQIFEEASKRKSGQRFWFDIGTKEWNYYVPMIAALKKTEAKYGKDIFYSEVPGGEHNAYWWRQRVMYPVILFVGMNAPKVKRMKVETEVIPSQSRAGVYYQRLNPIVTCDNGIKYSLATEATYTLDNQEAGIIKGDGSFEFNGTENLKVEVSYKGMSKKLVVRYNDVMKQKD